MEPRLPPPDPHEPVDLGRELNIPAPIAVFVGSPTPADDRVSDALLDLRPGLLIVCGHA
jgi:hypothetical protein